MSDLIRVLHVDDSPFDRQLVRDALEKQHPGFSVTEAASRHEFEARLTEGGYDIVLSDFNILGFDGLQVIDAIKAKDPSVPVVIVTGTGSEEVAVAAMKQGAADYVIKTPCHIRRLPLTIRAVLDKKRVVDEQDRAARELMETRRRLCEMLENVRLVAVALDISGNITFANAFLLELTGWTADEVLGGNWFDLFCPPDVQDEIKPMFFGGIASGAISSHYQNDIQTRSGERRLVFWNNTVLRDLEGNVIGIASIGEDITERIKAAEALRNSEEAFRSLFENSLDATLLTAPDGKVFRANPAACKMFGMSEEEVCRAERAGLVDPADSRLDALLEERRVSGSARGELNLKRKDGTVFPAEVSGSTFLDSKGVQRTSMSIRDISERKRAQEAQLERSRFLQTLLNAIPSPVFYKDIHGRYLGCNEAFATFFGLSREDIIGKTVYHVACKHWADIQHKQDEDLFRNPGVQVHESTVRHSDDTMRDVVFHRATFSDPSGRLEGLIGVILDVTESKKLERERDRLFNLSIDMLCIAGFDGFFKQVNPAWSKCLGWTQQELLAKPWQDFVHPDDRKATIAAGELLAAGKNVFAFENRYLCKDGSYRWLSWNSFPLPDERLIFSVARDVTDGKIAEIALRESEEKYRTIFDNAPVGICHFDSEGTITACNDVFVGIIGSSRNKLVGLDLISESKDERAIMAIKEALSGRTARVEGDYASVTAEKVTPIKVEVSPVLDEDGSVSGGIAIVEDLTERRRAEEALRESEEKYRLVVENAGEGIFVAQDGVVKFLNTRMTELVGYNAQEMLGKRIVDLVHPDDRAMLTERHRQRMAGSDIPFRYPLRIVRKSGQIRWAEVASVLVTWQARPAALVFLTDITERVKGEEALRESEERYRALTENSLTGIYVHKDGVFMYVNNRFADMLGYSRDEIIGKYFWEFVHPEDRPIVTARESARYGGIDALPHYDFRVTCKDGSTRWVEVMETTVPYGGRVAHMGNVADITQRRRQEEARLRLSTAVEQAGEAIIITDSGGQIQYVNPALERISGYKREEVIGNNPRMWKSGEHGADFYKELWDTITRGEIWNGRFINRKRDGTMYTEDATISPVRAPTGKIINYVAVKRDVTNEVLLQKQLFQAQKMESIGTLAGGIAHDFNNLLQIVLGYGDLLLLERNEQSPGYAELYAIHHAARRGAELVRQILTFSRKVETNPRALNLNNRVKEAQRLLFRTIPKMIDMELRLADDLKRVSADPGQIEQLILNLAVNARDAMPEGGRLLFETANVTLDEEFCRSHINCKPGEYALLRVSDTGHGIEKESIDRIFEPFFTTKQAGEGTGLGLAMVYGIVQAHGGYITCSSELGAGTTFNIYLPVMVEEKRREVSVTEEMPPGGRETILVVDDEELIASLGKRILEKAGYRVLTAYDGRRAIELYENRRGEISLVILDLVMPVMSGKECLGELLKIDPQAKILIASGFSVGTETREILRQGAKGFVNKPFDMRQLLRKVRDVLGAE